MSKKEEKTKAQQLKEKLFIKNENGAKKLGEEEIKKADEFCKDYMAFIGKAKTEREAVEYAVKHAKKAGFTEYDHTKDYKPGDRVYVNNRDKAIMLAVIGKNGTKDGVRLGIAHIDSPRL